RVAEVVPRGAGIGRPVEDLVQRPGLVAFHLNEQPAVAGIHEVRRKHAPATDGPVGADPALAAVSGLEDHRSRSEQDDNAIQWIEEASVLAHVAQRARQLASPAATAISRVE